MLISNKLLKMSPCIVKKCTEIRINPLRIIKHALELSGWLKRSELEQALTTRLFKKFLINRTEPT